MIIPSLKLWWWAEKVASTIGSELQKRWDNIFYLTFYDFKEKYEFLGKEICLHENFSNNLLIKIFKLFKRAYFIKNYKKKYNVTICLSFMEEANFPNILSKMLFKNKAKIMVSIRQSIDSMPKFYQSLIKLLYHKADSVIPNSEEERINIIKTYSIAENKIKMIHNPLNLELIHKKSQEQVWKYENLFKDNYFTFITVWRLTFSKDQQFLIDVFIKFNKKHPKSQLLIVWDWELIDTLIQLSKNNKNIHVLWNQKNVYKFLNKSDCFIFSSLREGFPNAILEAMACWLPIISTKFKTWITEIIWKNKYWILIDQNDEKLFFEAMEKIYLDKDIRNHYEQKSLERAKDFEIGKIIDRWKNVL